jgi:hypothetical protein
VAAKSELDLHEDAGHAPQSHRKTDVGAIIFVVTVVVSLITIGFLARNIFAAAQHLESAKRNAEAVSRDLAEIGVKRKAGQSGIAECELREENGGKLTWGPCWEEIKKRPEIAKLVNPMESANGVFGASCDGSQEAIGRIAIDKGTPWFSAGSTGTTFAPSDSEDSIATETPLRIQVCSRWGEPVKVQEIKF